MPISSIQLVTNENTQTSSTLNHRHCPSPVALPVHFLKKSAAVSTTPTFSATAAAIHWFKDTPSSFASRWAAFLMESGSFNGYADLLISQSHLLYRVSRTQHRNSK